MCEEEGVGNTRPPPNTQARWVGGRRRGKCKVYIGNTGKSAHSRMAEHVKKLERKDKNSCLYKHMRLEHNQSDVPNFKMKTLSAHRTNLERMISEGISIEKVRKANPEALFNSKAEWGRLKLVIHITNSVSS